jgi:hypothetical protein
VLAVLRLAAIALGPARAVRGLVLVLIATALGPAGWRHVLAVWRHAMAGPEARTARTGRRWPEGHVQAVWRHVMAVRGLPQALVPARPSQEKLETTTRETRRVHKRSPSSPTETPGQRSLSPPMRPHQSVFFSIDTWSVFLFHTGCQYMSTRQLLFDEVKRCKIAVLLRLRFCCGGQLDIFLFCPASPI